MTMAIAFQALYAVGKLNIHSGDSAMSGKITFSLGTFIALLILSAFTACGSPGAADGGSDSGAVDAGFDSGHDSGWDAGRDAALPADASVDAGDGGTSDASTEDSGGDGGGTDGAQQDSGWEDSGSAQDAGLSDGGTDAGTDGGVVDGGIVDAGVVFYSLSTSVSPAGGGTVSPSGGTYPAGSLVKVTAEASQNFQFDHWEGDASGGSASVDVIMDGNKSLKAVFESSLPYDVTDLAATPGYGKITLTWKNGAKNFDYAKVVRNDAQYPAAPGDGVDVCGNVSMEKCGDSGPLANGSVYYYKVFGFYNSNPSRGVPVRAMPGWDSQFVVTPKFFSKGSSRAVALKSDGTPCVAYGGYNMYVACRDTGGFTVQKVDAAPGVGEYASIAIDKNDGDLVHVSYFDRPGNKLKYASGKAGGAFQTATVDTEAETGTGSSISVGQDGAVHIGYFNNYGAPRTVKHAFRQPAGTSWTLTGVDEVYQGGYATSTAVDNLGDVHIGYLYGFEPGKLYIRYAYSGGGWQTGWIWGGAGVPTVSLYTAAIALDSTNTPHAAFYMYYPYAPYYFSNVFHAKKQTIYYWTGDPVQKAVSFPIDPNQFSSIAVGTGDSVHITYDSYDLYDGSHYRWHQKYITSADGTAWNDPVSVDSDPTDGDYRFSHSSIAVQTAAPQDKIHVSYYDELNSNIKIASFDGSAWGSPKVIDSENNSGWYASIAAEGEDKVHMAYYDFADRALKYARLDGGSWHHSTVDAANPGLYPRQSTLMLTGGLVSLAVSPSDGSIHISYYDVGRTALRHATSADGTAWSTEEVDNSSNVGQFNSISVDGGGVPHISYYNSVSKTLRHAWFSGTPASWSVETVSQPPGTGNYGYFSSIKTSGGDIHISYLNKCYDALAYSKYSGGAWSSLNVDKGAANTPMVGFGTSLAVDKDGHLHIGYHDYTNDSIKYAYHDGSAWTYGTVVDTTGSSSPSITAGGDYVYLSYFKKGVLMLARRQLSGGGWEKSVVDGSNTGAYGTIAAYGNTVFIGYYDGFNKTPRLARHTFP
jgi:hypothetical protein